jgi:cyclic beta-1,2-glucan synthetase
LGARFFESVSDTLGIFMDTAAAAPDVYAPARLAQLQQDLESATRSKPSTLTASRLCLDQLARSASSAAADVEALDADRESPLKWWARAFAGQCRDALDELTSLAPWAELLPSQNNIGGFPGLDEIPTLSELAALEEKLLPEIDHRLGSASTSAESAWIGELQRLIAIASQNARTRIATIKGLALQCDVLSRMQYDFLFDKTRHLLAIGYNVGENRRDSSYYDLLASEARLSCFVAIAQGQLPQESWFALGRLLTTAGGEPILLSWSGSRF